MTPCSRVRRESASRLDRGNKDPDGDDDERRRASESSSLFLAWAAA
jgi:hypothetical protein